MFANSVPPDPTALEQISSMINRYNQLVADIRQIEDVETAKNAEIENLKVTMQAEISTLKLELSELNKLIERATKTKILVGREFKQIVKSDSFIRLSKRIDSLNFEKRISRQEMYRLLERSRIQ